MSSNVVPAGLPISSEAWVCVCRHLQLSKREAQIARGVMEDLKECAIASRLEISTHTVHTHMERLYQKLGVNSRVQLVIVLMRCFLAQTQHPDCSLPPICSRYAAGTCPSSTDSAIV